MQAACKLVFNHGFAADFSNFAVKRTHAGFARVVAHNVAHRAFGNAQFAVFHAVALHLLGHEVLHGNVDFFVFRVAGQTDNFHAVEQGGRNIEAVGCGDKHHIAQIEIHFDKMVGKSGVLFRVEHFQQSGGRVATEVAAQFVDFVQQEQRVFHARFGHALHDFARHRADVGTAVSADFAFVFHAAQGHAHIFAPRGFGNAFAQRGFAHARRADQAQNRTFEFVGAFLYCQIFQNALFHFFQTVMVFVQHQIGFGQVFAHARFFLPRQLDERFDVIAHHGAFGRHRGHHFQFAQFGQSFVFAFLAHAGGFDLLFQLFKIVGIFIVAQFFLDDFDLLVQIIIALVFLHLALHFAANAFFQLGNFQFAFDLCQQVFHARTDIGQIQQVLTVL